MYYFIIKKYLQVITWNLKQNKKKENKYNNCSNGRFTSIEQAWI